MNSITLHPPAARASLVDALPVIGGYFVVSFVFGLMCINAGLPLWLPVAMCLLVYAGAAQFAALALIGVQAPLLGIAVSTLLINSRHMLMAMYMASKRERLPLSRGQKLLYAIGLTDESFALHSQRLDSGKPTPASYLLQFNLYCHASWVLGALTGALASETLGRILHFKLDYALTAMMLFVLVSLCNTATKRRVALVVIVATCLLELNQASPLNVFIATAIGCGVGACLKKST